MSDRLILLDGNNLMHRAYHALPLMDNRPGDAQDKPVEANIHIQTRCMAF